VLPQIAVPLTNGAHPWGGHAASGLKAELDTYRSPTFQAISVAKSDERKAHGATDWDNAKSIRQNEALAAKWDTIMKTLSEGDIAPDVELIENGDGANNRTPLASLRGRPVVLYFYPKDDTEGCTLEAKDFSALADDFTGAGVTVIGLSPDSLKRHANFCSKYDLKVRLASDPHAKIANTYGVWAEKQMFGRKYMGVDRSTFLIDESGCIARIWRAVKVSGHAADVLEAAKKLQGLA
jgi:peroxiredoxin Q/BCP